MPLRAKVASPVFVRKAQVCYFISLEAWYANHVIDVYSFKFAAGDYQRIAR